MQTERLRVKCSNAGAPALMKQEPHKCTYKMEERSNAAVKNIKKRVLLRLLITMMSIAAVTAQALAADLTTGVTGLGASYSVSGKGSI